MAPPLSGGVATLSVARELGFEPRTHRLHVTLIFLLGVDYIIIPDGGMRGASVDFINLLSFEIVSEPSMTFVKAWLLIAIRWISIG